MTLDRVLRLVALAAALLLAAPGAAAVRPNVVLVVVDDVAHADVARLDRLQEMMFRTGTELRRFATPDALCGPSRVSILRGQHGHNTGITTNRRVASTVRALGLEASTLATWLADAGYATALFGKYLNAYGRGSDPLARTHVPPGWTEWYGGVPRRGYGFWLNHNGSVVTYPVDGPHPNDVLADLAASFIARHAEQPMFLYVAPGSSHGDAPPAHRHEGAFRDAALPQGPSFNEEDVSDKPAWIRGLVPQPADHPGRLERHRNRLCSMLSVEDLLATVLRALSDQGVLDSTYLIFVSDNGYQYGEHRIRASKATAYDEALLVPAVIRGPGVPAGVAIDHLATNADLAVTIADLAGVAVPSFVDGRSLVPLLRGDRPEPRVAPRDRHRAPRSAAEGRRSVAELLRRAARPVEVRSLSRDRRAGALRPVR
ncbi:MAG: sulfatase [Deltaproteobacteria bacterium]|nr:sulfatase [Deltaproteobacteria bacterium]